MKLHSSNPSTPIPYHNHPHNQIPKVSQNKQPVSPEGKCSNHPKSNSNIYKSSVKSTFRTPIPFEMTGEWKEDIYQSAVSL